MPEKKSFKPKVGRIRDRGGKAPKPTVAVIGRAIERAGHGLGRHATAGSKFTGARIGRGIAHGALAAQLNRFGGRRRVVVKIRIARFRGGDIGAARAHLRYVQRDGVTREGTPGEIYSASFDHADGKAFLDWCAGDRHQFRIIVSPEDAAELQDQRGFVRDLMAKIERDLDTTPEWVAVDHFNTGHPHSHIVMRGKDERGRDLIIARDYLTHGIRDRASALVTLELGPETELESIRKLEREVDQERLTRLDRTLIREASDELYDATSKLGDDRMLQALRIGRLRKLEKLGLAERRRPGIWQLDAGLEPTLKRMGERGDIINTMARAITEAKITRASADLAIFDSGQEDRTLVGCIIGQGISDELRDRHYLIVDGIDGRTHYVDLGLRRVNDEFLEQGIVVEIRSRASGPRGVDRAIVEVAGAKGGIYTPEVHMAALSDQ
jgi:type IV secretory pathway VirD2 relaxase